MENSRKVITKITAILLSGLLILGAASDYVPAAETETGFVRRSRLSQFEAEDNTVTSEDDTADSEDDLPDSSVDDADKEVSEGEDSGTGQKASVQDEKDSDVSASEEAGDIPDASETEEAGGAPDESAPEEEDLTGEEQSLDYSQTEVENSDEEQDSTEDDSIEDVSTEDISTEEVKKSTEQETAIEEPEDTAIVSTPAMNGSYKAGDKLLTLGEEGTITQYPLNPKRTNGFDDYRIDVSSYEAKAYTLDKQGKEIFDLRSNGDYQELQLRIWVPEGENVWGLINEDANVVHYDIQGPNVKKVLKEKAHDKEIFIGYGSGRLCESGGSDEFRFDQVCSGRLAARLHLPNSNCIIKLHYDIYYRLLNYEVDELRQYDSASEFVKAEGFMQSDDIYKEHLGTDSTVKHYQTFKEKHKG